MEHTHTTATAGLTTRQRWAAIAQGIQHDVQGYQALQALLGEQFHAALRHDAPAMQAVAERITAQADQLAASSRQRVQHAKALLPQGVPVSMAALFAQLPGALSQQLQKLWQQLEGQVQTCQSLNRRNGQLIMEQAETMRQVRAGGMPAEAGIYAPR